MINPQQVINVLQFEVEKQAGYIAPTISDYRQFECNVKAEHIKTYLQHRLDFINKHKSFIGANVYHYSDGHAYIDLKEYQSWDDFDKKRNKVSSEMVLFTTKLFEEFVSRYIAFQINRMTELLTSHSIFSYSTNPLLNLVNQYQVEANQEMLRIYKDLLNS